MNLIKHQRYKFFSERISFLSSRIHRQRFSHVCIPSGYIPSHTFTQINTHRFRDVKVYPQACNIGKFNACLAEPTAALGYCKFKVQGYEWCTTHRRRDISRLVRCVGWLSNTADGLHEKMRNDVIFAARFYAIAQRGLTLRCAGTGILPQPVKKLVP